MATTKDKQKIRNAKEVKEEQKEIKTTKCKRGKKICVQCAEKGLEALNPINCKECQTCGYKFYRKQNTSNMLKHLAKFGTESYSYLDTIKYSKGDQQRLSIILNKTRVFEKSEEGVKLKKRDFKRMTKDRQFILNPSSATLKHLPAKASLCSYQTVHLNSKEFDRMNTKVQDETSSNSMLSIKYKDRYYNLPEEVNENSRIPMIQIDEGLMCCPLLGHNIKCVKWIPIEEFIHPDLHTVYYCSVLTQKKVENADRYTVYLVQYMKTGGKIYNSFEIELDDNENEIISVPQIEWIPPLKNKHRFYAECIALVNTTKGCFLHIYELSKEEETTKINLKNQILMSKDIELNVCKTWKNFCAIGDAKGNIVILDRIVEKKSRRKEANNISKLPYKIFKLFKNAHELEVSGLEFITGSVKYGDKIILCSISKDGYLRLWNIHGSSCYPVFEISGINKRWMYDVVWDPSIQRLHYLPYNVLHLNEVLANKKSNLIKENTTSVSSRHTSRLVLVSSINGCVYGIQKQTKPKDKPKDINAEVIFRIEKQFEGEKCVFAVQQKQTYLSNLTKVNEIQ